MKTRKDIEEKELLALERERSKLWDLKQELGPLEKPFQRGWMRCYFLTEEARLRADTPLLEAILAQINVIRYHWKRSFEPSRRNRRAQLRQLEQPLAVISRWRWQRRDFPESWRPYFSTQTVFGHWQWALVHEFRWPELFELRVVPRMVTHSYRCNPAVASRLAEIEQIFENPRKQNKLYKLLGCRNWRRDRAWEKCLERLAAKRIRAAMAGDVEAEKRACVFACFLLGFLFAYVVQEQRQPT